MKALSIRQPWAWLVVTGHKDIENREWSTNVRGRVLVHASKSMTRAEYKECEDVVLDVRIARGVGGRPSHLPLPQPLDLVRGGIIGTVEIVDCVQQSASPWFFGSYGFVLRNARPMRFIPYRGRLGFFDVPEINP